MGPRRRPVWRLLLRGLLTLVTGAFRVGRQAVRLIWFGLAPRSRVLFVLAMLVATSVYARPVGPGLAADAGSLAVLVIAFAGLALIVSGGRRKRW